MYNETLLDHFYNPRHIGELTNANGTGTIGDPGCGDFLKIYLRVEDEIIKDISFLCQGCPAAIASGSATCELAIGKTLREAIHITEEVVSDFLGGMPEEKIHCSNLGVGALRYAIGDYLGIRHDKDINTPHIIERLRGAARIVASEANLLDTQVRTEVKGIPPETAIGNTADKDYPIWKWKEGIIEASVLNGIGQAFTPVPTDFLGDLGDVLALSLDGNDSDAIRNRSIFVAVVNAMCNHLGLCSQTIHCKDTEPVVCARDLLGIIDAGYASHSKVLLIGFQPRMAEALAQQYDLRVIDLDPDNVGKKVSGFKVESGDNLKDALSWCELALVTGSTLVNGTIDDFVGLDCHTVFYGVTIAGASALLQLPRFCSKAM